MTGLTGANFHFEHAGIRFAASMDGTGAALVLLHGLGGDRSGAFELADPVPGWRRLALDQRGHGETEPVGPESSYKFEVFAADLIAFLDTVEENSVVVLGVSMGSAVALRLALENPDRVLGLVLVRPAWIHEPMTENLIPNVEIARLLRLMPAAEALAAYESSEAYARIRAVSSHAAESLSSQFFRPKAVERAVRLDQMPRSTPYTDPRDLSSVAQPTLVIGCERDPLHPIDFARTWASLIPNASLECVSSSADGVSQHRREVRESVARFLLRLGAHAA